MRARDRSSAKRGSSVHSGRLHKKSHTASSRSVSAAMGSVIGSMGRGGTALSAHPGRAGGSLKGVHVAGKRLPSKLTALIACSATRSPEQRREALQGLAPAPASSAEPSSSTTSRCMFPEQHPGNSEASKCRATRRRGPAGPEDSQASSGRSGRSGSGDRPSRTASGGGVAAAAARHPRQQPCVARLSAATAARVGSWERWAKPGGCPAGWPWCSQLQGGEHSCWCASACMCPTISSGRSAQPGMAGCHGAGAGRLA